jgi:hypothetical protein
LQISKKLCPLKHPEQKCLKPQGKSQHTTLIVYIAEMSCKPHGNLSIQYWEFASKRVKNTYTEKSLIFVGVNFRFQKKKIFFLVCGDTISWFKKCTTWMPSSLKTIFLRKIWIHGSLCNFKNNEMKPPRWILVRSQQ